MIRFSVDFKINNIKQFKGRLQRAIRKAVQLTSEYLQKELKTRSPKKTGKLSESFKITKMSDLAWKVFTTLKYAIYNYKGTGIYAGRGYIYPKKANALRFSIGGKTVFAKRVRGQKPNKYPEHAIRITRQMIPSLVAKAVAMTK